MDALTILGLSKTGAAVAHAMQPRGVDCFVSDGNPDPGSVQWLLKAELEAMGVAVELGQHSERCLTHAETVVLSPGIPPQSAIIQRLSAAGKHLISEIELAWQLSQQHFPPVPWVGITGTNGKTTTTRLVSAILTHAGKDAPATGNIGLPPIQVLTEGKLPDVMVAELSSYQLAYTETLRATVAVFLNLTPDHLDWHGGLEAYEAAKARLFIGDHAPEWAILRAGDPAAERIAEKMAQEGRSKVLWFSVDLAEVADRPNYVTLNAQGEFILVKEGKGPLPFFKQEALQIKGSHNLENVLAAIACTCLLGISPPAISGACQSFAGVEHRLERVRTLSSNGAQTLTYFNDSKATNPQATLSALRAFKPQEQVILLAGGRDKNGPLDEWVEEVKQRVSGVWLFGEAQTRFAQALHRAGYTSVHQVNTLEEALAQSCAWALQNPVLPAQRTILLSPACASFDQFENYEARGQVFKQWVLQLDSLLFA